jgi:hypothetical protein
MVDGTGNGFFFLGSLLAIWFPSADQAIASFGGVTKQSRTAKQDMGLAVLEELLNPKAG